MTRKITYILDPRDVIGSQSEKALDTIKSEIALLFPQADICVAEKSFNKFVIVVKDVTEITDSQIEEHKNSLMSKLGVETLDVSSAEIKSEEEAEAVCDAAANDDTGANNTEADKTVAKEPEISIDERIEKLTGNGEVKRFAEDIRRISGFYQDKRVLRKVLLGMSYLVAINSGNGRSTVAKLMGDIVASEIGEKISRYSEYYISDASEDAIKATIEPMLRELHYTSDNSGSFRVCVVHLDGMDSKFNSSAWHKLLNNAWDVNENTFFIFMISYLEDVVLADIHRKIDDILCNKVIKIAPFTNEMYITLFENHLSTYNVSLSPDAHPSLLKKLAEEKADGNFYGINTVYKICSELMFYKAINSANADAAADVIGKQDVDRLLSVASDNEKSGIESLDEMIALEPVKKRIREILATIKMNKASGKDDGMSMHMVFSGAPGTGKTAIARIIGQIFKEENILTRGDFYEVGRKDLVGSYVGTTAPKTAEICKSAYGSILFIDEAYSLAVESPNDFGREAVSTLIAEMENNRDNMVVIFAGYENELENLFDFNPGLRHRVPYHIYFPNYSREELYKIFCLKLPDDFACDEEFTKEAESYFMNLGDDIIGDEHFSNGRYVRNLVERIMSKAALRIEMNGESERVLTKTDFILATSDIEFRNLNDKAPVKRTIGFLG